MGFFYSEKQSLLTSDPLLGFRQVQEVKFTSALMPSPVPQFPLPMEYQHHFQLGKPQELSVLTCNSSQGAARALNTRPANTHKS